MCLITLQTFLPLFSHESEGVFQGCCPPPLFGEIVLEKRCHPLISDGTVETPHQRLFLHGQVENGCVQWVILSLEKQCIMTQLSLAWDLLFLIAVDTWKDALATFSKRRFSTVLLVTHQPTPSSLSSCQEGVPLATHGIMLSSSSSLSE